ncbi:hypothetical protein HYR99_39580 [Candidatus Poribacteria bacterium]|nr:hypothetical protein [Candidatus Poribacteria bacterium]
MTPRLDTIEIVKLASLVILLILVALFSAVEVLFNRLTRNEILSIAEAGGERYETLTALLRDPRRYSATMIAAKR